MKKALFGLLVIAVGLSLACDQKPTGNTNANANRPLVTGTTHTVGINLALKPGKDTYHFEVAPSRAGQLEIPIRLGTAGDSRTPR
jgi:hypothetical protein